MKRFVLCFIVCMSAILVLMSVQIHAAVISHDWKTPGDGLLTYDTVNNREWLDLSQTLLSDQFPGSGSTPLEIRESRYQYVVSQTAPGGLFEGFTVAQSADAIALAQSAGIDTSTLSSVNVTPLAALGNLLGFTIHFVNGNKLSVGLIDELYTGLSVLRLGAEYTLLERFANIAGLRIGYGHIEFSAPPGVMLYRGIPEPITLNLLAVLIMAKGAIR
jgi:hypothetical protein